MRAYAFAAFAAAALCSGSAAAQVTVLRGATLIDGSGAAPQSNVTIVIENGRLPDIGTGAAASAGAGVIELLGKFVVPGIINGHGHVGPAPRDRQLRLTQGYFEHRQMELLVQAGLTPMQIIQAFSKNNAEMFGIDKETLASRGPSTYGSPLCAGTTQSKN